MKNYTATVSAIITVVIGGTGLMAWAEKYPVLPAPNHTASAEKPSTTIPWPAGESPKAPAGYVVSTFAELESPRSIFILPSGNVLVAQAKKSPADSGEKSPNQIAKFEVDEQGQVVASEVFLEQIELPFGMAVKDDAFFVATPTQVLKYPMKDEVIAGPGVQIAELPFPKPQRHWTRHLLLSPDGTKLFVSVGSASNVGEDGDPLDPMTAAILSMNLDGSDLKVYASGIRNAVTMAIEPTTQQLWATVNERDELGDGLVPDYLALIKEGGFYGWPYAYWGQNEDPRLAGQRPDLVAQTIVPNYSVGAHTASTGIAFTAGTMIEAPFDQGAFITQRGSWNSSTLVGYKVIYVPFENGDAIDPEEDFLTGFVADPVAGTVYGRPVMTAILGGGQILVTDDAGNRIWMVKKLVPQSPVPVPQAVWTNQ